MQNRRFIGRLTGATRERTTGRVKCPRCSNPWTGRIVWARMTGWRPPHGIDPQLREFRCECGWTVYARPAVLERDRV